MIDWLLLIALYFGQPQAHANDVVITPPRTITVHPPGTWQTQQTVAHRHPRMQLPHQGTPQPAPAPRRASAPARQR